MVIKAVFFDFDGTISNTRKIAEDSLVLTLDEFGFEYDKEKAFELLGIKMRLILKKLGLRGNDVEKIRKRFYEHFTQMARDGGIGLCVSLKPLWEMKKDLSLVVVSNSDIDFLTMSIKTLKIKRLFSEVYGAEKNCKKNDILRKLFRKMGIKASEAIYVGDRFSDVVFARKAGCVAVAIYNKCSWSTLNEIKRERPDYVIRDFYGLRRVVKEIDKK
jgi:phosphoglycolate phosphatase-like HAD superfamily hydrolase